MKRKWIIAGIMIAGCLGLYTLTPWETENYAGATEPVLEAPQPISRYVYISGAVKKPGLYAFSNEVRLGEAIQAAGDVLPYADTNAVNYAEVIQDGMHIHIPYDTQGVPAASAAQDGRININEADEQKLAELPGIGPAMAKNIVTYRTEHGFFTSIEELQNVKGIGAGKFKKLQDKVTV